MSNNGSSYIASTLTMAKSSTTSTTLQTIAANVTTKSDTSSSTSSDSPWNVMGALALNGRAMVEWWEIALAIELWVCLCYLALYFIASVVSLIALRKHSYVLVISLGLLVMSLIGPITIGLITSASIAFAICSSDKGVVQWQCMVLGLIQAAALLLVSFSRLLGTL